MTARQIGTAHDLPEAAETIHDSETVDILVADDESIVCRLLEMALQPSGIRLETARNGAEALQIYQKHHGDVRLVLLDVQMPVLDGPETFRRLQEINPDVRVVFMSGDIGEHTAAELLEMGALGIIQKPFSDLMMVASRLRQIAAGGGPAHAKCHR